MNIIVGRLRDVHNIARRYGHDTRRMHSIPLFFICKHCAQIVRVQKHRNDRFTACADMFEMECVGKPLQ